MKKLKDYTHLIFFDLETTGFDPYKNEIIELSLMVTDPVSLSVIKSHSHLVKPKTPIPYKITELTGITSRMVEKGISEEALFEIFNPYNSKDFLWLAYNIQFDIGFVEALLQRYKSTFTADILDVMAVYKDVQPPPHALKNAIETYQIIFQNTHRAADDVLATIEVVKHLNKDVDVNLYINQIGFHSKYGLKGPKYDWVNYHPQENIRGDLKTQIRLNKGE